MSQSIQRQAQLGERRQSLGQQQLELVPPHLPQRVRQWTRQQGRQPQRRHRKSPLQRAARLLPTSLGPTCVANQSGVLGLPAAASSMCVHVLKPVHAKTPVPCPLAGCGGRIGRSGWTAPSSSARCPTGGLGLLGMPGRCQLLTPAVVLSEMLPIACLSKACRVHCVEFEGVGLHWRMQLLRLQHVSACWPEHSWPGQSACLRVLCSSLVSNPASS